MSDRDLEFWDATGKAFREIVNGWPANVRKAVGDDIRRVQRGDEPRNWKPLTGFAVAAGEVRHKSGARVVYSVAFVKESGKVFIADAFMKDSREKSEMRKDDRERIKARLKRYKVAYSQQQKPLH